MKALVKPMMHNRRALADKAMVKSVRQSGPKFR